MKYNQSTLDKIERVLDEAGYVIRYERGNFQSGYCILEDRKVIVLNKFLQMEGAKEIKLYGKYFPVRATIEKIDGLSSHADQKGLIDWLSELDKKPSEIHLIHGETEGAEGLKNKIRYGISAK